MMVVLVVMVILSKEVNLLGNIPHVDLSSNYLKDDVGSGGASDS